MKKITTRFGEIEYDPANIIHFPEGLVGLEDLHDFIVMPNKKKGPLFWIQCVDHPEYAFVVTDPTNFFLDYAVPEPGEEILERLKAGKNSQLFVLAIVTVHPDQKITLNLKAPLFFAPESNRAVQVILENAPYDVRTPLPEVNASET
ncbi:flagellar assembly protein FliW [Thermodesulfobacteriota bacterium B35]